MICKWCGEAVEPGQGTCSHCGKELPPLSECGGFYNVMPEARLAQVRAPRGAGRVESAGAGTAAAGLGAAASGTVSRSESGPGVQRGPASRKTGKKNNRLAGLLLAALAMSLLALVLTIVFYAVTASRLRSMEQKLADLAQTEPPRSSEAPPSQTEEPEPSQTESEKPDPSQTEESVPQSESSNINPVIPSSSEDEIPTQPPHEPLTLDQVRALLAEEEVTVSYDINSGTTAVSVKGQEDLTEALTEWFTVMPAEDRQPTALFSGTDRVTALEIRLEDSVLATLFLSARGEKPAGTSLLLAELDVERSDLLGQAATNAEYRWSLGEEELAKKPGITDSRRNALLDAAHRDEPLRLTCTRRPGQGEACLIVEITGLYVESLLPDA